MSSLPQPLGQPWKKLLQKDAIAPRTSRKSTRKGSFRYIILYPSAAPIQNPKSKIQNPKSSDPNRNVMKFNSTVALTFVLLILMVAAGAVSGLWGYAMGYEALKGVTQPDTSPSRKLVGNKQANGDRTKLTILLKEEEILKQVKAAIRRGNENLKNSKNQESSDEENAEEDSQKQSSDAQAENQTANLPISDRKQGITMEVVEAKEDGGSLLLEVNLKNESSEAVRFLYSFLEVKDNRGRTLSAVTDGLPGELPPNSEQFSGVVKVPTALLEGVEKVSLSLTDYPDRKLQLSLSDIPVD